MRELRDVEDEQFVTTVVKALPPKVCALFVDNALSNLPFQPPQTPDPRGAIQIPAVTVPHQGASYNPPLQSHQELLLIAHNKIQKEEEGKEGLAGLKKTIEEGQKIAREEADESTAIGMSLDPLENDDENASEDDEEVINASGNPSRKTKKQKEKAKKLKLMVGCFN